MCGPLKWFRWMVSLQKLQIIVCKYVKKKKSTEKRKYEVFLPVKWKVLAEQHCTLIWNVRHNPVIQQKCSTWKSWGFRWDSVKKLKSAWGSVAQPLSSVKTNTEKKKTDRMGAGSLQWENNRWQYYSPPHVWAKALLNRHKVTVGGCSNIKHTLNTR